jgi:fatty acid desaturase
VERAYFQKNESLLNIYPTVICFKLVFYFFVLLIFWTFFWFFLYVLLILQVNLGIYIQDNSTELSLLVDRSVGGSSLVDGQIELMLHRFV